MIAPHIEIDAGGAASYADDPQHPGLVGVQDAGALQAVARRIRRIDECDQIAKLAFDHVEPGLKQVHLLQAPISSNASDRHRASQQPASGEGLVHSQNDFTNTAGVRVCDHESDVGRDGSDIGDVVVHALELQQAGAAELCPHWTVEVYSR